MRRRDREISRDEGLAVIDKCEYAVLSVADGVVPYSVPLSVCRSGNDVYFHSAMAGRKTELLTDGTKVRMVFVGDVRAAEDEFTTAYESAIATGEISLVRTEEEKIAALRMLSENTAPPTCAISTLRSDVRFRAQPCTEYRYCRLPRKPKG